jgi:DNA-binding beta-propeller fold protein YncE
MLVSLTAATLACAIVVGRHALALTAGAQVPRQVPIFEVDPTWPKLPNNWVMGVVSAVAVDRHDNIWLLNRYRVGVPENMKDRVAPPVLEFDAAGKFVQAWGGQAGAEGYEWPGQEHCLYVDDKDNVWIGGTAGRLDATTPGSDDMLLKLTTKGKLVLQIGRRGQSTGPQDTKNVHGPADVFVYSKTNEVFVGDEGNLRVIVFDAGTGAFKRMWSAFGNVPLPVPAKGAAKSETTQAPGGDGPQQFGATHAVRVSNDGFVYVADRVNRRIQVFTIDGKYVTQKFLNGSGPSNPSGLAFSADPEQRFMYVAENETDRLVVVDRKSLEVLYQLGKKSVIPGSRTSFTATSPGEFQGIHYLAVDSKGNLFTSDVDSGNRVQRWMFKGLGRPPQP